VWASSSTATSSLLLKGEPILSLAELARLSNFGLRHGTVVFGFNADDQALEFPDLDGLSVEVLLRPLNRSVIVLAINDCRGVFNVARTVDGI
jgi:hypothetical protein